MERHLSRREERRTALAERARQLRRNAQIAMSRLHEGHDVALAVEETRRELASLGAWIRSNAPADAPLAHDALQEAVEACLLYALSMDRRLPGPDELRVEPEAYLLGLADTVGEVRRIVLHDLSAGRVDEAERRLLTLEALYRILLRFETTRAILPLKPKQDAARGMLEKTRGEVTMARLLVRARLPPGPGSEGGHH
ncbi:MAG TPA: hypothetical protein VIZ68_00050 [Thermoplasmata archaeon]